MAPGRLYGCLALALALAAAGCTDKKDPKRLANAARLDQQCEQLGKVCGDSDKHTATLVEQCKAAAAKQTDKGCTEPALAAYACYAKEVCGEEKVWVLDDFRVLTERHKKCVAEYKAVRDCGAK
jgi:hypothetical protein